MAVDSLPVSEVRAQADRIEDAVESIERALVAVEEADEWRACLGYVEAAQRRVYRLRKAMLDEAIRSNREGAYGDEHSRSDGEGDG